MTGIETLFECGHGDEQQELGHVVRLETQSAMVSETEQALLDSFVKTLATSHE